MTNKADAIKMACDFVSIEGLPATLRLANEFRHNRLSVKWGDDVLQIYNTLYYAWEASSKLGNLNSTISERSLEQTASSHFQADSMSVDPTITDSSIPVSLADSLAKPDPQGRVVRRREKNRQKREIKRNARQETYPAGCNIICQYCGHCRLHRGGIFAHVWVHPQCLYI